MIIHLNKAKDLIFCDDVVAVPTETVYGLAARFDSEIAIQKIFSLKKRPKDNPLIIHLGRYEDILHFLKSEDEDLLKLAQYFWPGPLTIVGQIKKETILPCARAHLETAAFRVPSHPLALELIRETKPLVMPSANLSGRPSATRVEHVLHDFGEDFPVIDGGDCRSGLESTVIAKINGSCQIVRSGCLLMDDIADVLNYKPLVYKKNDSLVMSPGMKYRHYAPKAKLSFFSEKDNFSEQIVVGFLEREYPGAKRIYHLGSLSDPQGISKNLYHVLRQLDHDLIEQAFIDMDFPREGLFKIICERLEKAAI